MAQIVFIKTDPENRDFYCPKTGALIREEPSDATVFLYNADTDTLQLDEDLEPLWEEFEASGADDFTEFVRSIDQEDYIFFVLDAGDEKAQKNLAIIGIDMGPLPED
jgi:hypothetical protein